MTTAIPLPAGALTVGEWQTGSGDEREGTAPQSGTSVHVAERNHPPHFYESSMSGKAPARRDANGNRVVNYS